MKDHVKNAEGCECKKCEQDRIITAYQIAKDNLELRLLNAQEEWLGVNMDYCPRPAQVY